MTKIEWVDDYFCPVIPRLTTKLEFKPEGRNTSHTFNFHTWQDMKADNTNYMGGSSVDFTHPEGDVRSETILQIFEKFHKKHPQTLPNLRQILEPGAGSGAMSLILYKYFREKIFVNGLPNDFQHTGVEFSQIGDDWYKQQEIFEDKLNLPSYPFGQFATHYKLQKGIDFMDYLDNSAHHEKFDAILGISIYDLLLDYSGSTKLLSKTRKLLRKGGIFFLAFTDMAILGETPKEAGFVKLWPEDNRDLFTFWQAV